MTFNIYGVQFSIKDMPPKVDEFISNEWNFFKDTNFQEVFTNINIHFTDNLNIEDSTIYLSSKVAHHNNTVYLNNKIKIDISQLLSNKIQITCKNNIGGVELFWLIERILFLKLLENGYTLQHASCFKIDNKIVSFSSLKETGKSKILMHFLDKKIKFISDDVLILDDNFVALPYPRGMSIHKYHGNVFYELLKKSTLKIKLKYLLHLIRKQKKFTIRLYLHNLTKKINTTTGKLDKLYILEKKQKTPVEVSKVSNEQIENFLVNNIQMEFFGIFYEEFKLLDFINTSVIQDFKKYLENIESQLKLRQKKFVEFTSISKIAVDNQFSPSEIEKVLYNG